MADFDYELARDPHPFKGKLVTGLHLIKFQTSDYELIDNKNGTYSLKFK